ncbi:hypothetical protein LO762_00055 [Actinocorallia sp. API 0066]|uniref:hypothetical protein n=1 Tax=Actinocorallia sp. API 0066 TaxID=2896846 RepID=UPI001E55533A|nr:hypothetical protein [Actinocorallia sp. API 0066]MCD0447596.1 hypothetical protein [Actinocorallia sp. API 0066]
MASASVAGVGQGGQDMAAGGFDIDGVAGFDLAVGTRPVEGVVRIGCLSFLPGRGSTSHFRPSANHLETPGMPTNHPSNTS